MNPSSPSPDSLGRGSVRCSLPCAWAVIVPEQVSVCPAFVWGCSAAVSWCQHSCWGPAQHSPCLPQEHPTAALGWKTALQAATVRQNPLAFGELNFHKELWQSFKAHFVCVGEHRSSVGHGLQPVLGENTAEPGTSPLSCLPGVCIFIMGNC